MATFISNLLKLKSFQRKIILFFFDSFICLTAFFFAFYLRLDLFLINETSSQIFSFLIVYVFFLILSFSFKFYKPLSRYYDLLNISKIILVYILYIILITFVFDSLKLHGIPRSIGILHPLIFLILFISSRALIVFILGNFFQIQKQKNAIVLCYSKNVEFLKNSLKSFNILSFIVNDNQYDTRMIGNISIKSFSKLEKVEFKNNIDVLFIEQSLNTEKLRKKFQKILGNNKNISIKIIPKPENFLDYQFKEDVKNIKIFKKKINYSYNKLEKKLFGSTIMITGSGGSIGSELVKEILKLNPNRVLLIENSEYNLYRLLEDLSHLKSEIKFKTEIIHLLASVTNLKKMEHISSKYKPDYIFHCAAYKHVPLVEKNIIESLENNYKSTINLCRIALKYKVSKLILISSDKAVRPSSIMGSTKRLSELAIKYYASISKKRKSNTSFSAVRFANVLNSSGSVVPLFAKQIQAGGPITITDKKVERYFMTISDAVKLVLETTLISKNGEIMLLKMGKQIKILKIAQKLANFYGKSIRDKENPNGEIDIVEIGLRPGEKIREELYYDKVIKKTANKDILCVDNLTFNPNKFKKINAEIDKNIQVNNYQNLRSLLLDQKNML